MYKSKDYLHIIDPELRVLLDIVRIIAESDGDSDTLIIKMPPDSTGYSPRLQITVLP